MESFDPTKPLPEHLLQQFLEETKVIPEVDKKPELAPDIIIADPKAAIKRRQKAALDLLDSKLNRQNVRRTTYGNMMASKTKLPVASESFAQYQPKKSSKK